MSEKCTFDYAVFRLVPRVEREEFFNVGVILSCPGFDYLASRVRVNESLLQCFDPELKLADVTKYMDVIEKICSGVAEAGPIAQLPPRERFYWLTAQRSTIIQCSPVHTGLTDDPERMLEQVFERYVS